MTDTEEQSPWRAVFESLDGVLHGLPYDTIRIPMDGTLRMQDPDGDLHPTHRVCVVEGDKLTYNPVTFRPPVEPGYLDGVWPALPRPNQTYVTIYLSTTGYRIIYIDGKNMTPVTYEC
jgi:hypothetical protein